MNIKGLKPAEAIAKFISEYMYSELKSFGFKLNKDLSMVRSFGDFRHTITISKNKWNYTDTVVRFNLSFGVNSKTFKKWYIQFYHPENTQFIDDSFGGGNHNTPGWDSDPPGALDYDLYASDHDDLAKKLCNNLINVAIPLMERLSDYRESIHYTIDWFAIYPKKIDMCFQAGDKQLASELIERFDAFLPTYKGKRNETYPQEIIDAIELRRSLLEKME